jgi:hypothetical protein
VRSFATRRPFIGGGSSDERAVVSEVLATTADGVVSTLHGVDLSLGIGIAAKRIASRFI